MLQNSSKDCSHDQSKKCANAKSTVSSAIKIAYLKRTKECSICHYRRHRLFFQKDHYYPNMNPPKGTTGGLSLLDGGEVSHRFSYLLNCKCCFQNPGSCFPLLRKVFIFRILGLIPSFYALLISFPICENSSKRKTRLKPQNPNELPSKYRTGKSKIN